ncbi:uncharacterized protein [Nicotiana tomentosiformis]|uniref:uncharacterized protein n=1 Tax=Nicotiana tomentosiformis TaxID=4098 RepID=UPI00388CC873
MKGIMRFGKSGKLSPRFIGTFEVLKRFGEVAYSLALPPNISQVHPVFHISMLWSYHADRSYVLDYSTIKLNESLGNEEESVDIVDGQVCKLRSKKISAAKVQWRGRGGNFGDWGGHTEQISTDIRHSRYDYNPFEEENMFKRWRM